jgi:HTH-type transcriptional regulator / antitoxin HigA
MATKIKDTVTAGGKERGIKGRSNTGPLSLSHPKGASAGRSEVTTRDKTAPVGGPDPDYMTLIKRLSLRPIRTDAELDLAAVVIDELTDRDDLSPAESDYLDVLGDLIEKFENEHVELPHVSDAAMLGSLMEEKGVSQADVVRGTGISRTVRSLVRSGKRDLTRDHIKALSKYFDVNPAVFLGRA